ncbi:alpha/beta hydrolase [Catellatospora sp. KI3]|uniref:alpha/beta fold hydrolase n=1 Tax=Catellatospora sp. KI3 TaxID=3041620 RepID=UPI0024827375|nr:alpha/beta hydrolase [Catellatospora sp. KI3]MDI1464040.1 alpha/beta hydrolase [Catellatospora sp. KI3]
MPQTDVVTEDGCRLWTERTGTGDPVVLCHGGPGLADYLGPVAALLDGHTHVVRWDQRGCGRSERTGPYTIDRFTGDLDQVIDSVSDGPVVLLGHSWGASLALFYALSLPHRVRALIYVSGVGTGQGWKEQWHANVAARRDEPATARLADLEGRERTEAEDRELAVLSWTVDFAVPETARRRAEELATPWFPINWECNRALGAEVRRLDESGLLARCGRLAVPTLILDGAQDPRPRDAVDPLFRALPRVHRVTFPSAGHLPWIEEPEAFARALRTYLAELP